MNITIFVIAYNRASFFCRAAQTWKEKHNITFLTTRYHIYRYVKKKGLEVYMLQDFIAEGTDVSEFAKFKDDAVLMARKAGFLGENTLERQFIWLCNGFKNYFTREDVDKLIIWNGSLLQGYIASEIADSFHIGKLFFEIGNFPNKIFVDPEGVNAKSSLMDRGLSVCENYDKDRLVEFLTSHKNTKEKSHIVPQAKSMKKINFATTYEHIYNVFSKYPIRVNDYSIFFELKRKLITSRSRFEFDKIDIEKENYILFPLQVSVDSQVVRNSDVTIEESIDYALNDAIANKLSLVIKPHPAEKNKDLIAYIRQLKENNKNLYLTNQNTYQLIKHSKKVITINSTVGIEGLMYYKHVEVLGRAFYKPYCEPNLSKPVDAERVNRFLYNYLFNCLVDGNYFGSDELQIEIL